MNIFNGHSLRLIYRIKVCSPSTNKTWNLFERPPKKITHQKSETISFLKEIAKAISRWRSCQRALKHFEQIE